MLMGKAKVAEPVGVLVDHPGGQVQSDPRAEAETSQPGGVVHQELGIAEADQRLVSMVNVLVVELDRVARKIRVARSRIDDAQGQRTLQGNVGRQPILPEQADLGHPERGMVLLRRLVPLAADGADLGAIRVVLSLRACDGEGEIEPEMMGSNGCRLCAPDRERGVASPRSGRAGGRFCRHHA